MNRDLLQGLAIGVGLGLAAPILVPTLGRAMRPMARAAIRQGVLTYEKARESMAELGEYAEDMVAEARAGAAEAVHTARDAAGRDAEGTAQPDGRAGADYGGA